MIYNGARIDDLAVSVYTVPTDEPESDGTLAWEDTTLVLVQVSAAEGSGLGYSYASAAAAELIRSLLSDVILGRDAFDVMGAWHAMVGRLRNQGRPGISSMAISAVDVALWDLKARLLEVPLVMLLGRSKEAVAVYGSGGFTSYSDQRLQEQLGGWIAQGIPRVKMKVGREPERDDTRVRAAREAIGPDAELFVDGNGAYGRKESLAFAEKFADSGVSWFEEPVSSDDLEGLRLLRNRFPSGMEVSAGEYGYDLPYFLRMLEIGAVDVLQADVTRCGGVTGFLAVGPLSRAFAIPLSAHTAPALSVHVGLAESAVRHVEYFHDHVRIERMLFDGAPEPRQGELQADLTRPGLGLEFKSADAERYRV